jgi:hypothetical protein
VKKAILFTFVLAVVFALYSEASAQVVSPRWLRYLGNGSEGDYSCTSGTCVLGEEHWFSSFSVSAGSTVIVQGGNGPLIIRSTGACTVAGVISNSFNSGGGLGISGTGDFGGTGGGGGGGIVTVGRPGFMTVGGGGKGITILNGGAPGAPFGRGKNGNAPLPAEYHVLVDSGSFWPVGGSKGGAGGGTNGAPAGSGGGPVILVCNSINFTGSIDASGGPGNSPSADNSGAGGGGGGGYVILAAVTYAANTGVINTAGGPGGSCNSHLKCGAGGNGGKGFSTVITIQ